MATVDELQAQLAQQEQLIASYQPAIDAAQQKLNSAQQQLDAYMSQPNRLTISQLIAAKNAAAADPNNAALQQAYQAAQSTWDAQQAIYLPLLQARDAASQALIQANQPKVAAEEVAAQLELEIARLDPSQASPEATAYLKENGELPIDPNTDPALAQQEVASENYAGVPLSEPPDVPVDEFDGIDEQVAANENALQEPPMLSDEEIAALYPPPEFTDEAPTLNDPGTRGTTSGEKNANTSATNKEQYTTQEDWRVRLSLAPGANYLYAGNNPGILQPLKNTKGVIFPYTPSIQISYSANYDATDLVHSNYKVYQYKSSSVDNISITCDFTAQDTFEADYLLAVIHFFRSVTKMFYGKDNAPKPGTPPPLCFLSGLGEFQFNDHPLAITSFTYSLPADVDYIRAGNVVAQAGVNRQTPTSPNNPSNITSTRLTNLGQGGSAPATNWSTATGATGVTYVPTRIQLQIGAVPVISRASVSNTFSLDDYGSGKLLKGIKNVRGGFW